MGRVCSVCAHPEVEAINQALVSGEAQRAVARRFGLSRHAVHRHANNHLPVALLAAKEAEEALSADNLLAYVRDLRDWARRIAAKAEAAGDLRAALLGIRECARIVALAMKWRGMLSDGQGELVQIVLPAIDGMDLTEYSDRQLDAIIGRGGQGIPRSTSETGGQAEVDAIAGLQARVQQAEHRQRMAEEAVRQVEEALAKKLSKAESDRDWAQQRADRLQRELNRTSVMYVNP